MSRNARISLLLFTSILLLFTILWFKPVSHLRSPILAKNHSFFGHQDDYNVFETITYQDNDYEPENPMLDEKDLVVKDVVVLTEKNFSDFIARNQYVLVNFYASWCYWSRRLAPEYSAAATMLKSEAVLAKVEATEEKELARKYEIQGYPTVSLFVGGVRSVSYYGERTREAIATWIREKMGLLLPTITTMEEAKEKLNSEYVIVMGFLHTLEGSNTEELAAASKLHAGVNFYQTDNVDVARLFGIDPQIKRPALVMLKWEAANRSLVHFDGPFTRVAISVFVSMNKLPSVITFTSEGASDIFNNPMKQLWFFAPKYSLGLISTFEEAAKAFREKLLFVYVETDDEASGLGANLAYQFGVPEGSPRVVAYMANGGAKYVYHGELTFAGIKSFAEELLEDQLSIQSVPTSKTDIRLPSDSHTSDPALIPHAY